MTDETALRIVRVWTVNTNESEAVGGTTTNHDVHILLSRPMTQLEMQAFHYLGRDEGCPVMKIKDRDELIVERTQYEQIEDVYLVIKRTLSKLPDAAVERARWAKDISASVKEQQERIEFDIEHSKDVS